MRGRGEEEQTGREWTLNRFRNCFKDEPGRCRAAFLAQLPRAKRRCQGVNVFNLATKIKLVRLGCELVHLKPDSVHIGAELIHIRAEQVHLKPELFTSNLNTFTSGLNWFTLDMNQFT